jgi:hypothetical protein
MYYVLYFHLILQLLLLKEKECNILRYRCMTPLLKERGWGEVRRKRRGVGVR